MVPTKHLFQVVSGATPQAGHDEYWDGDIIWVTPADFKTDDRDISKGKRTLTQQGVNSCSTTLVPAGSLIFSKRAPIGAVVVSSVVLCTNQGCLSSVPYKPELTCVRYFYYVMAVAAEQYELLGSGTTFKEISATNFSNFVLPVPVYEEQQQIVAYLDTKCSQVDTLIANVQAQIEKLKQYKQSLITEVVTRGLDPSVPMKDSGVEWIGKIASHFNMKRLKDVALVLDQYRKPITADQRSQDADVLYDYYGASGVIDKIDGYTIDDHVMLIGEDGANLRMRNLPLMYEVNGKAWINNHAHILKPKDGVDFNYLFYALEGLDLNPYITGSAQPKLSQENLRIISIPIPALEEQVRIAEFIHKQQSMVDQLLALKQAKIDKLSEYKKSLIYEYVTGKKEVS